MTKGNQITRALAVTTALSVVALGATTTAADAASNPGHGKSQSQGKSQGKSEGKAKGHEKKASPSKGSSDKGSSTGTQGNPDNGQTKSHDQGENHPSGNGHTNGNGSQGGSTTDQGPTDKGSKGSKEPKGSGGDPAGNNGTVKITPHGEVDGIPQNTPHVGCVFDVEWYGFDEGDDIVSQVTFQAWAPTRVPMTVDGPAEVFVGADPASGAGVGSDADGTDTDNGFDGEATYTLSFDGEPHPQQGYHVKLTINTPGSQGADVKHKVFWVQDCEEPETPDTPDSPDTPETPDNPDTPDTPEVAGEQGVDGDVDTGVDTGVEVLGEQATASTGPQSAGTSAAVPTAVDAGLTTAQWIASTPSRGLLVVLVGLLLAGAGLVVRRRA